MSDCLVVLFMLILKVIIFEHCIRFCPAAIDKKHLGNGSGDILWATQEKSCLLGLLSCFTTDQKY